MNKITIYKVTCTKAYMMCEQGTGFSLAPWGNNTATKSGGKGIFDAEGMHYHLGTERNTPILVSSEKQIYLRRADNDEGQ